MRVLLRSRMSTMLALIVLGFAAAGRADTQPTLVSIDVDGDLSDWQAVLTNPVQVSHDGDGSSYADCSDSPDRDCPVSGGVGRDLLTFAWTYDSTNIYMMIERWGSSSNSINFFFVMDLDGDMLAGAGDQVVRVRWSGSNRSTSVELYSYVPANGGGDELVDSNGLADGYSMPGNIGTLLNSYAARSGGEASGTRFEEMIPWADLGGAGLAPGTPVYFHISSNNNTSLNGVTDNMGGPGGGVGSFGFGGVSIEPARVAAVSSPGRILLAHVVTNLGNLDGLFDLRGSSALGLSLSYFSDPDGDGNPADGALLAVDADGDGDFSGAADMPPGAADDTNANGQIDFPIAGQGAAYNLVVQADVPAGLDAMTDTLRLAVVQDGSPGVTDDTTDTLHLGYIVVFPDQAKSGMAGQYIRYPERVTNNQAMADTAELSAVSSQGWRLALYSDPDQDGDPADGALLATDADGDGIWDSLQPGADSDADGLPDSGLLSAQGGTAGLVLEVSIPVTATVGTLDSARLTAVSAADANRSAGASDTTTVNPRVSLDPDYLFADQTQLYGAAGRSVFFPFLLTNSWISADTFSLSWSSNQGWPVVIWSDPNGDGAIDDGAVISFNGSASSGGVAGQGGRFQLVAEVQVPATAAGGDQDTLTLTAASNSSAAHDDAIGQLEVHLLQTFADELCSRPASNFATCESVYAKACGLAAGTVGRYQIRYYDPAATLIASDTLNSDALGQVFSSRTFAAADGLGNWTLELWDESSSASLDQLTIEHSRAGSIDGLVALPNPIASAQDLHLASLLTNTNPAAAYFSSVADYVVRSPDGSLVLLADGSFVAYTGSEVTHSTMLGRLDAGAAFTDGFTVSGADFPDLGSYSVNVGWRTACGGEIASAAAAFAVDSDSDGDGVPDSVDICPLDYNPSQDLLSDPANCARCGAACDDGLSCTDDGCSAGACVFNADDGKCTDDGLFCDGPEICDLLAGCVPAGDPCLAAGRMCDEASDACVDCLVDDDCDDGLSCTSDGCVGGECTHAAEDGLCDDGDECSADRCDLLAGCENVFMDADADGICDAQDPCPDDPANDCNGCDDRFDPDGDGMPNCTDPCPYDSTNKCTECSDSDQDGVCDEQDACPYDPDDRCKVWQGSQLEGGGCNCATGGAKPWLPGLGLLLLLGGLRRRRNDRRGTDQRGRANM